MVAKNTADITNTTKPVNHHFYHSQPT